VDRKLSVTLKGNLKKNTNVACAVLQTDHIIVTFQLMLLVSVLTVLGCAKSSILHKREFFFGRECNFVFSKQAFPMAPFQTLAVVTAMYVKRPLASIG